MASSCLSAGAAGPSLPGVAAAASAAGVRVVQRTRLPFAPYSSPRPACPAPASQESLLSRLTRLPSVRQTPSAAGADSAESAASSGQPQPFSVLFVCLGNICRSPAAEGVFRSLVSKKGLETHFKIDSAGTIGYHEGDPADPRMRAASKKRGIEITSISRPIRPSDFKDFDLILAMDLQNKANAHEQDQQNLPIAQGDEICPIALRKGTRECTKRKMIYWPSTSNGASRNHSLLMPIRRLS